MSDSDKQYAEHLLGHLHDLCEYIDPEMFKEPHASSDLVKWAKEKIDELRKQVQSERMNREAAILGMHHAAIRDAEKQGALRNALSNAELRLEQFAGECAAAAKRLGGEPLQGLISVAFSLRDQLMEARRELAAERSESAEAWSILAGGGVRCRELSTQATGTMSYVKSLEGQVAALTERVKELERQIVGEMDGNDKKRVERDAYKADLTRFKAGIRTIIQLLLELRANHPDASKPEHGVRQQLPGALTSALWNRVDEVLIAAAEKGCYAGSDVTPQVNDVVEWLATGQRWTVEAGDLAGPSALCHWPDGGWCNARLVSRA